MKILRLGGCALLGLLLACSSKPRSDFDAGDGIDRSDDNPMDPGLPDAELGGGDAGDASTCISDPGNFEIVGDNCDNDGDGQTDNVPACDDGTLPETGDAVQFAKSMGICNKASGMTDPKWGLISATYSTGYMSMTPPDPNQHGILKKFGSSKKNLPREGKSFGVLSSGWAREYNQCNQMNGPFKGGCSMMGGGMGTVPPGFPKAAMGCQVATDANDVIVLSLKIKAPKNAKGLKFDFNFFSGEWPEFVCTTFNDSFIAYLKSSAFNNNMADNISFDSMKNPVSVNNGFFDVCSPMNATTGCAGGQQKTAACKLGDMDLQGTGFYAPGSHMYCANQNTDSGGGATGWLTTQAPVKGGEVITLEFYIFDVGDSAFDSSVILDKFEWLGTTTTTDTIRPPN